MPNPVAGHGALIATEANPVVPATFVSVAKLTNDVEFAMTRPYAKSTPHNDSIDSGAASDLILRDPVPINGDFLYDAASHDQLTGLQKHFLDNTLFGMLLKGPSWVSGLDEIICSGQLIAFKRTAPNNEGIYGFEAMFQPSGLMTVDTVVFGAVDA